MGPGAARAGRIRDPGLRRYARITIGYVGVAPTSLGRVKALYN